MQKILEIIPRKKAEKLEPEEGIARLVIIPSGGSPIMLQNTFNLMNIQYLKARENRKDAIVITGKPGIYSEEITKNMTSGKTILVTDKISLDTDSYEPDKKIDVVIINDVQVKGGISAVISIKSQATEEVYNEVVPVHSYETIF